MADKLDYRLTNFVVNSLLVLLAVLLLTVLFYYTADARSIAMDTLSPGDFERDVVLPPANFHIWPLTRIGAIVIDVILLVVVILLWVIPRRVYKTTNIGDGDGAITNGYVSQFKMWGFWVCGLDSVTIDDGEVTILKRRGYGCCSIKEHKFPKEAIVRMDLKRRSYCSLGIVWAFFISCLCGIWLHFIPCIWWTCDWGYFDGQGVRGAIWFTVWGLMFFALLLFYPIMELEMVVQINPNQKPVTYMLAVGEGCARKRSDPVASYDLENLRKLTNVSDIEAQD